MPRTYKSKDKQTKPSKAGAQNLPADFIEKNKCAEDTGMGAIMEIRENGSKNRKTKGCNWTAEELEQEITNYFQFIKDNGIKPSKVSLSLWLGVSDAQIFAWVQHPQKYGVISDLMKDAFRSVESQYIQRIESYPTGNAFLLRTSHGHVEASKLDVTTNGREIRANESEIMDIIGKLGLDK